MYCFRRQYVGVQSNRLHTSPNGGGAIVSWMDDLWSSGMQKPLLLLRAEPRWNRLLYINKRKGDHKNDRISQLVRRGVLWGASVNRTDDFYRYLFHSPFRILSVQALWLDFKEYRWHDFKQKSQKQEDNAKGMLSSFEAISTAIGGTVGFGNIAGVATAVAAGGPGAVLWMWLSACLGMILKQVEVTLGCYYRHTNEKG